MTFKYVKDLILCLPRLRTEFKGPLSGAQCGLGLGAVKEGNVNSRDVLSDTAVLRNAG